MAPVFCSSTQCVCFGESLTTTAEIVHCGQSIQLGVQHEFECPLWEVEDAAFQDMSEDSLSKIQSILLASQGFGGGLSIISGRFSG